MGEDEKNRLIAWNRELTTAHQRLREALRVTREIVDDESVSPQRDLLLYCQGFCAALSGHHVSEDTRLFPELLSRYPAVRSVITKLEEDHAMIAHLLAQLDHAKRSGATPAELLLHLDGIGAIMDSHFQYEERQLLAILETLDLDADPHSMLGPL